MILLSKVAVCLFKLKELTLYFILLLLLISSVFIKRRWGGKFCVCIYIYVYV